jgi:hypothetical protein
MTKFWRTLKTLGEIAAGIVALIAIIHWLAPNPVKLKILVKQDELQLPAQYREYLHTLDRDRNDLSELHNAVTAAAKQEKDWFHSFRIDRELAAIRAFTPSVPIFSSGDPHLTTVKIVNNGWKIANNVKVFSLVKDLSKLRRIARLSVLKPILAGSIWVR